MIASRSAAVVIPKAPEAADALLLVVLLDPRRGPEAVELLLRKSPIGKMMAIGDVVHLVTIVNDPIELPRIELAVDEAIETSSQER